MLGKPPLAMLEAFVAFAHEAHMVAAAKRLGITQPALTQRLQALEHFFPHPLFAQKGRRKVLTPFAEKLYRGLWPLFGEIGRTVERASREGAGPETQALRVGCRPELVKTLFSHVRFKAPLQWSFSSGGQAVQGLMKDELDCALSSSRPDSTQIIAKKLFETHTLLARPKSMLGQDLYDCPMIYYQKNDTPLKPWYQKKGLALEKFTVAHHCENWNSLVDLVNLEVGMALIPDWMAHQVNQAKVEIIRAAEVPPLTYWFLYRKDLKKNFKFLGEGR